MNFWELTANARLSRLNSLIETQATDVERWADAQNADGAKDHSRSKFVARFIPPGSSVLDIGCGSMSLNLYLADGCSYTPADIVKRSNTCHVIDLNKGEFPSGNYDCIVFLGVLEYVFDVGAVLHKSRLAGRQVFVDYNSNYLDDVSRRRRCGWVNDFSPGDFLNIAIAADWKNLQAFKVMDDRYLYVCNHELVT